MKRTFQFYLLMVLAALCTFWLGAYLDYALVPLDHWWKWPLYTSIIAAHTSAWFWILGKGFLKTLPNE